MGGNGSVKMPRIVLEDSADRRLDDYRSVKDGALWRERGLFVAEGRLVVRRVIEQRTLQVRSVLVNPAADRQLDDVLTRLSPEVPVYTCNSDVCTKVSGFAIHRGCLALVQRPDPRELKAVLSDARLVVVTEALTDPDNVGGVFRNAAAFGADAVILSPTCCDPLYRKAIRTSMGMTLRVPFARAEPWPDALDVVAAAGFTIAALTPGTPAGTIDEFAATTVTRIALLVGTEGAGLSAAARARAHVSVRIPIAPQVDSLNVAVATGIALSRLSRLTPPHDLR
jgi:tRNA G18 (ribose-2'-O)-methylase SpoU